MNAWDRKKFDRKPGFLSRVAESIREANELARQHAAEEAERLAEWQENEAIERAAVEDQISEYERSTGQKFVRHGELQHPLIGDVLIWDPNNKGHLLNCPDRCLVMRHCLTCGADTNSHFEVFCKAHR